MSKITEIAFTGYPITNVKRARAFYEGLLGLKQSMSFGGDDEEHAWIEYDVGPHTLALVKVGAQWKPSSDGPAAALEVSDFDAMIATLRDASVPFTVEPQDYPSCKMAVVKDPDGNGLCIHYRKPKA